MIRHDVITKKPEPFTNMKSTARVNLPLLSRTDWGISTYYMTNVSEVFLVALPLRDATSGPKIVLALLTASGVTEQLLMIP